EGFHHDHGLDRPAADATVLLGERQRREAEIDVLPPHVAAPAVGLLQVFLACLELVALCAQALDRGFQHALLFGKFEGHAAPYIPSLSSCPAKAGLPVISALAVSTGSPRWSSSSGRPFGRTRWRAMTKERL